jgi:general nucleoside transport system ATP-binding protein
MAQPPPGVSNGQGAASANSALLEARAITKRFGDFTALDAVDFSLAPGEIHALLGENGAGKSTLMNVLSGVLAPTRGVIALAGAPVRWHGPRDAAAQGGIGMVHQHFQLVPVFTVLENLVLAVQRSGLLLRRKEIERQAEELAASLGWRVPMQARTGELPVGAQQRVEIVKALLLHPRILFFDEPTAVLTPAESEELFVVLRALRDRGESIVFVSHKLAEVKALCDRVTILRRGRVVGRSAVSEIDELEMARAMVGADIQQVAGARASGPGADVVLQVDSLCASAGGRDDVALQDVSFTVHAGEILGIAGVDGNGQTELFEALIGLRPIRPAPMQESGLPPVDRRPIRLAGAERDFKLSPASLLRLGVAWIPPDRHRDGLALSQSVERNLLLTSVQGSGLRQGPFLSPKRLRLRAASWMNEFDVRAPSLAMPAASLSGGNQQKIVVARAVARHPALLIAASPTRGLDVGATAYVHQKLRECQERNAAVLLLSSELDEVRFLADRIAVIYEGRIIGIVPSGAPAEQIGLMMGGRALSTPGAP